MKIGKGFLVLMMSASVLTGCNQGNGSENSNPDSEIQKTVKKHEAVTLPVYILADSNYKDSGTTVEFKRSITDVEIKDFDDSSKFEFIDRYGDAESKLGINLQKDFKLLVITMKHEVQSKKGKIYESYMLNEGSDLVIGEESLANKNEFLKYQLERMTKNYSAGSTYDELGIILFAIPNEFAEDKNLQLKVVQEVENEKKYIYIDLN